MLEPTRGFSATITHTVTAMDAAAFEGRVVHAVYGTPFVVREMEHASRQALLPFIESGEEGVGREVFIQHLAPTPLGRTVTFTATITDFTDRTLTCDVIALDADRVIARGSVVQGVVVLEEFRSRYRELTATS